MAMAAPFYPSADLAGEQSLPRCAAVLCVHVVCGRLSMRYILQFFSGPTYEAHFTEEACDVHISEHQYHGERTSHHVLGQRLCQHQGFPIKH